MSMDWNNFLFSSMAGLAVFYYGLRLFSESIQAICAPLIRQSINALTENRVVALWVGFSTTFLVQSSTVSSVATLGFVNAGLMSIQQSMAVLLGANLATIFLPFLLIVASIKIATVMLAISLLWLVFAGNGRFGQFGKMLFALGLIFWGFEMMNSAFVPHKSEMQAWFTYFNQLGFLPVLAGVGVGAVLAAALGRWIATYGVVLALLASGSISFAVAVSFSIGTGLGTTLAVLFVAKKVNAKARRAAYSIVLFNFLTTLLLAILFSDYLLFIDSFGFVSPAVNLAVAHLIYCLITILCFLPFLNFVDVTLKKVFSGQGKKQPQKLILLGDVRNVAPSLAIEQAFQEVKKLAAMVQSLLSMSKEYLCRTSEDVDLFERIQKYEKITDNIQFEMNQFISLVIEGKLTRDQSRAVKSYLRMTGELESIADKCELITEYRKRLFASNIEINSQVTHVLEMLIDLVIEQYDLIFTAVAQGAHFSFEEYDKSIEKFNSLAKDISDQYFRSVSDDHLSPAVGVALNEISVQMRAIRSHTTNVVDAFLGRKRLEPT